jgi:hypothetical protein
MILISSVESNILHYNDTEVDYETEYYYYVNAENIIGESERSNTVTVTTESNNDNDDPEVPIFWIKLFVIITLLMVLGIIFVFQRRKQTNELQDGEEGVVSNPLQNDNIKSKNNQHLYNEY